MPDHRSRWSGSNASASGNANAVPMPYLYSAATFDPTGRYRYCLTRVWEDPAPRLCFVLLNPSTADAARDDPTLRRCQRFAALWGYGAIEIVNLFAFRSTDPRLLDWTDDPVGPENDRYIDTAVARSSQVVCAWGNVSRSSSRATEVLSRIPKPSCLGCTKAGHPCHPLYLPLNRKLEAFSWKNKPDEQSTN
jgi:hypothetical protein